MEHSEILVKKQRLILARFSANISLFKNNKTMKKEMLQTLKLSVFLIAF